MNFEIDFRKSKNILNEMIGGYFSVWRRVLMLRESIESAQRIQESNSDFICLGAKCIQEALFYSSVTDIRAWFIDSSPKVASLHHVVSKLEDEYFSKKLEAWYSYPPSTISLENPENGKHWHKSYETKRRAEFRYMKSDILKKYRAFCAADETKRLNILRSKYVAHKEFKNSKIYDVYEYGHKISDAENALNLLNDFIFYLNNLFNKSSYIDRPADFDMVCKEFWSTLQRT